MPRKILHIGANRGGEARVYAAHGIQGYLVEAIPAIFEILRANCAKAAGQTAIQACLDEDICSVEFNVSSNFASSSMLDLGRHAVAYPDVVYQKKITLQTQTTDGLIAQGVVPDDIDFAVLDVQGAELKVLRGAAGLLSSPALLGMMIEVSSDPLYAGGATYLDICRHLEPFGFYTKSVEFNEDGWGDALFVRRYWKLAEADIPPLYRDYAPEFKGRNIAPEGQCSQSSVHAAQGAAGSDRAVLGPRGAQFSIHTKAEPQPWWQVNFGVPRRFGEVVVFNRLDEGRSRADGVRIAVSDDLTTWRDIWANVDTFGGVDGRPLRVACPDTVARAMRIIGMPDEYLHLNRVEIYDASTA